MYNISKQSVRDSKEALLLAIIYYRREGWSVHVMDFCRKFDIDYPQVVTLAELIDEIPEDE